MRGKDRVCQEEAGASAVLAARAGPRGRGSRRRQCPRQPKRGQAPCFSSPRQRLRQGLPPPELGQKTEGGGGWRPVRCGSRSTRARGSRGLSAAGSACPTVPDGSEPAHTRVRVPLLVASPELLGLHSAARQSSGWCPDLLRSFPNSFQVSCAPPAWISKRGTTARARKPSAVLFLVPSLGDWVTGWEAYVTS